MAAEGAAAAPGRALGLLRLAGAVLVEAHDEWQVSDRRYLSEGSMALLANRTDSEEEVAQPALIASLLPTADSAVSMAGAASDAAGSSGGRMAAIEPSER